LLWSVAGLLTLLLLAAAVGVLWLRAAEKAALPMLDGELHLAGLSAPVTVRRDAHGVPHIEAAAQDDLFVAQGYVTAQDRLWQMDLLRRNANGELAEVMGSSMIRNDRMQRVLQIRKTAERVYANLSAEDRAGFDAYARGVNLFIEQHPDTLPAEFKLLHYRPQPWSGADSVSIGLMMAQTLDTHWYSKLEHERIAARLNNPKLEADLYPVGSWRDHPPTGAVVDLSQPHPEPPPATNDDEDDDDNDNSQAGAAPPEREDLSALGALLGLPACAGCAPGSNNWVVAGRHTASGKPLLSNDMHLSLTEPNIWYTADLSAPGFQAAGVTLPGVPFVIAGHNEHVAWGFTALYADVQDLYMATISPATAVGCRWPWTTR
jgi:penicillin amidase